MDGWQNIKEFDAFIELFGTGSRQSWIHALRNPLILGEWLSKKERNKSWKKLRYLWRSDSPNVDFGLPKSLNCDVLIYCSSDKPNVQPAMNWLAQRLGSSDISTIVWGPTSINGYPQSLADPELIAKKVKSASNGIRFAAIRDIPTSVWYCISIYSKALFCRQPFAKRLVAAPRRLFAEIVVIRHMVRVMVKFLQELKPQFIITNGEQTPYGLALTVAARATGIRTVWFYNEWPTSQMLPILSDELWVWNSTVEKSLSAIFPNNMPTPEFKVVGMAQLDCMEEQAKSGEVTALKLPGKQYLVFLSEHIPSYVQHNGEATEKALQWLSNIAQQLPQWNVIIKPRPYHSAASLPGEQLVMGIDNIQILRDNTSIAQLLATPEVKAFASLSSSGLLLAAATGRKALRLAVSGNPFSIPPLDEVVERVNSPTALCEALQSPKSVCSPSLFPYRGEVLDYMKTLCCQRTDLNGLTRPTPDENQ